MAELLERHDPYTERDVEPFERLCVSIVNQQLSTESAAAVRERAFETLGEVTPEHVLAADETALREAGLSASKVEYLRNAARAFRAEDLRPRGSLASTTRASSTASPRFGASVPGPPRCT